MTRVSGLSRAGARITWWQRLTGPMLAPGWSRSAHPPVGAAQAGIYAAALTAGHDDPAIARCLLWCDAAAGQYVPARLDWYRQAADASPNDERCVFFIAALCRQNVIADAALATRTYASLLRSEWAHSPCWDAFNLSQTAIADELAGLYARDDVVTPERVQAVAIAFRSAPDRSLERATLACFLARAYRQTERRDADAQTAYAVLFAAHPDDGENTAFLADLFARDNRRDGTACAVYARMAARKNAENAEWSVHLARTYLALGRLDGETLPALRRAQAAAPGDNELAAGVACAASRQPFPDEAALADLVAALDREADLAPIFARQGWDWNAVLRTLALGWGRAGRTGEDARALYARVTALCPEEGSFWVFYGRALAAAGETSDAAVAVYERAQRVQPGEHATLLALGRAFLAGDAARGPNRTEAIVTWESLYRQGMTTPEMVSALAQAYTAEERVSDVALAIWAQVVEAEPRNGKLRVRMAREFLARNDVDEALKWYRAGAKLCPRDFEAQYQTGRLLLERSGDYAGAEKLLAKAVKLGTKHLNAHFALGECLLAQDKRDAAKLVFQKIVDELDAHHTPSLLHLARLNLRYDDRAVATAEALYEQARAIDPDRPETYLKLAHLYREKGQHAEEQQALETFLKLSAPDPEAIRQLADLYIRRGDFVQAEGTLRQLIGMGHGDKKLYTLLGEVMVQARAKAA